MIVREERRAEIEKMQREQETLLDKKKREYENRVSRFLNNQKRGKR